MHVTHLGLAYRQFLSIVRLYQKQHTSRRTYMQTSLLNLTLYSPLSKQLLIMMQIFNQHRDHQILNLHYNRKKVVLIYVILLISNCSTFYLIMTKSLALINMASSRTLYLFGFIAHFAFILPLLFYCSLLLFPIRLCLPYHHFFL